MIQKKLLLTLIYSSFILISTNSIAKDSGNIITPTSIGNVRLGTSYAEVIKLYKKYKPTVIDPNNMEASGYQGIVVESKNNTILMVHDHNYNKSKVVKTITTCSDKFYTKEGIRPGMKLFDLVKIYPNFKIEWNKSDDAAYDEYFKPSTYQTKNTTFIVVFGSDKEGQNVGIYPKSDFPFQTTTKFKSNAKVSCITIYEEKN